MTELYVCRQYNTPFDERVCAIIETLEEHDKQIRSEVFNKVNNTIEELLKEPQYQHEGEDWMNGLIMAQEILYDMSSELEE